MTTEQSLIIVGGGLAGTEAAWQAAQRGIHVQLMEMRPGQTTGAHQSSYLAELVCSNSLGSNLPDRPSGVLKNELRELGSFLLECAEQAALPAGNALAVDREVFSRLATERIESHPNIELIRCEVSSIPNGPAIIASGPLTSPQLSKSIGELSGQSFLHFYDAIAPTILADSIDMQIAFRASRFGSDDLEAGDYINCPFTKQEYLDFVEALRTAERIPLRDFELKIENGVVAGAHKFFEGCLPVEIIANRGIQSLAFGPMRPIGLKDPRTGKGSYAVIQLRQDNLTGTLYNIVGFQTNLTYAEQKRVFRMVPGLQNAEFMRFGQMHRNTFIAAPVLLMSTLQFKEKPDIFFAGQITGVEGYMGNIATGLLAGWNAARMIHGEQPFSLPRETMLGALCHYITNASLKDFQPMKANFGILPPLVTDHRIGRRDRSKIQADRARSSLREFLNTNQIS